MTLALNFNFETKRNHCKISYELCVYEAVDKGGLSQVVSQKLT